MTDERITCPLPSRRQWQGLQDRHTASSLSSSDQTASGSSGRQCAERITEGQSRVSSRGLRAGLLLALGAMTVAIPLSGFVGSDSSVALPVRAMGAPLGASTWVTDQTSAIEQADLGGSATAASRARGRAPIVVDQCLSGVANGATEVKAEVGTLYWPIAQGAYSVVSPFGMRVSPITGQLLMHEGVDHSAAMGEPLYSVYSGRVVEVSENSRSGALVKIRHEGEDGTVFYSLYLHQYIDQILVAQGDEVSAGQRIGAVGSNGWSTGPHLHFEIHDEQDQPVDPQAWMQDHGAIHIGEEACA
ncbi:M23 family metallopeptidase [Schaalia vaccimaxillae]|uniref:M23 family metallopeptidase n=1 Tax=Schaalia vaccimaxillae TaxID=183916 RepID=UPI0003B62B8E|nr:M23 family metallopeptidase [Schaalia vaccimaxillae]